MLGLIKTYALQGLGLALLLSLAFGGIQSWRLSSAKAEVKFQALQIADLQDANKSNQVVIKHLRVANGEWSAKCKADEAKTKQAVADIAALKETHKDELKKAKEQRQVIYKESKDACHNQPVPAGVVERLRSGTDKD